MDKIETYIEQTNQLLERGKSIIEEVNAQMKRCKSFKLLLQSQLESEKPVLSHGDWWLTSDNRVRVFLIEHIESKGCVALEDCLITNIGSDYRGEPILGNIFDDLKAMSEPLEEFTVYGSTGFKVELKSNGDFKVSLETRICTFDKEQIKEIHRKLGRLIATDKRKAAKE